MATGAGTHTIKVEHQEMPRVVEFRVLKEHRMGLGCFGIWGIQELAVSSLGLGFLLFRSWGFDGVAAFRL